MKSNTCFPIKRFLPAILILFCIHSTAWSEEIQTAPPSSFSPFVAADSAHETTSSSEDSNTSLYSMDAQPLSAPTPEIGQQTTADYFKEKSLSYFESRHGLIETQSGYPFEGFRQTDFTQPTAIGFYALLLANVITGEIVTEHLSKEQAKAGLNRMMDSLLRDQETLGFKGLMPWLSFDGQSWERKGDSFGEQVVLGDNVNLSASLGAAIGALSDPALHQEETAQSIRVKMETFLDRQEEGYQYLYDPGQEKFRRGWNYKNNEWVGGENGRAHYFGDEFRGGILFLALRYGFPDSVYTRLDIVTKEQTLSNGEKLQTVLPFDGGAFQMLWPILTMPETQDPALNTMLRNFVTIALDYSRTHNLPGLLSASYGGIGEYAGNAGITDLSFNGAARNENVPSLYALGAARMIAPQAVDEFLEQILAAHPDLATEHGFWEGINISTGDVIQEQIVANVTSFILGLAGTGPKHMGRYLDQRGLSARLQSIYLAENSVDVIADSSNIYTWGNGNISSSHSGSEYSFSASQFYSSGTAFIQNGINISGKKLRIAYSSFGPPVTAKLEFKERARDGLELRHRESSLVFLNTSGQVREIEIDLPPSLALLSIDEIVLLITMGTGGSINLKIKKFEVVPQDFHDLIAGSTDVFSWGDNVAGYRWQKDEYRIQSQQFSSSGTAFLQKGINAAGGELRIRYRSSTPVGKVKFEFKERKSDGLQIQLEMHDIVFQNTGNKDQEIAIPLPMDVNLSKIDELVMLVSDGNGSPLDLVLVDLDIRLHHSVNLISESINHFTWGNGVSGQRDSGDEYLLRSDAFYSSGTAFIQNVGGINIAGKKLEIRYRSNSDVGKVKFEFKEQKADGLHIQYVTPEIQFVNTGGGERKIVIDLPALFELFNIHEAVMLISEGQGGPLDLRITQLAVTPQDSRDLIAESTGSFSWGENNIRGAGLRDSYFISSPSFYSSGTVFTQNNLDLSGNRFIRLRYQSIGSEIRSKLEFKVQQPDGVQTVYETEPIDLSNTQGSEKEILISLPAGLDLLGIDEVVLTLFGGSGRALDLTVLDLDIF